MTSGDLLQAMNLAMPTSDTRQRDEIMIAPPCRNRTKNWWIALLFLLEMVATARRSIGYSIAAALLAVASSVTAASSKIPNQKTPHPIVVKNAPDVNDSILIVGAGASGIHMAYTLANKGYKNITVMERLDYIGGKIVQGPKESPKTNFVNLDGIDTGALLLTSEYATLLPIIAEFGLTLDNSTAVHNPVAVSHDISGAATTTIIDYESAVIDMIRFFAVNKSVSDAAIVQKLGQCVELYSNDWLEIYYPYYNGFPIPNQIPATVLAANYTGTAAQYFNSIGCPELNAMVAIATTLYGYGSSIDITKYFLFSSVPPPYFALLLKQGCPASAPLGVCSFGPHTTDFIINPFLRIKEGFHTLFQMMAAKSGATFMTSVNIQSITRAAAGTKQPRNVHVVYTQEGKPNPKGPPLGKKTPPSPPSTADFDFLIISSHTAHAINQGYIKDPTPEEMAVFGYRKTSTIVSTLVGAESPAFSSSATPTLLFLDTLLEFDTAPFRGTSTAVVDFTNYATSIPSGSDTRYIVSYQIYEGYDIDAVIPNYVNNPPAANQFLGSAKNTLFHQLKSYGFTNLAVEQQNVFSYSPQLTEAQIQSGLVWKQLDIQGTVGTWYIGAGLCYEITEFVASFNLQLLNKFGI